jgi:hypothetical protein
MPTVDQVKNKVLRMLSSQFDVRTDSDGDIVIKHESAICWVGATQWNNNNEGRDIVVTVTAPVLWEVKRSPKLFEYVATKGQKYMIGRMACNDHKDDLSLTNLFFEYNLLADNLDEPELINATLLILSTANNLDDELQKEFGGKRTSDL